MLRSALRIGVSALTLVSASGTAHALQPAPASAPQDAQDAQEAQTAPPSQEEQDAQTGPEIVVTARLRGENLQDVPLSIAAFSEQAIERQQINDLDRLSFAVPSLSASDPFGRNNPSVALRGIGLAGIGDELPVGIFIDGVYVAGRSSANLLITDLERIEVARGPQSALYGRNTFAGAINFVTKKPGNELDGYVEGTLGSHDRYELRGGVSTPLVHDRLFVHLGAIYRDWGGFYENQNPAGTELNRQRTTAFNGLLRWTPTDRIDVSFRANYAEDDDTTAAAFLVPLNIAPTLSNGGSLGFFAGEAPTRPVDGSECCTASANVVGFQRETQRYALTMGFDVNDNIRITSITAHTDEGQLYDQDVDYRVEELFSFGNIINRQDFSQELRAAYSSDRLNALVGAFYYDFDNRFQNAGYAQFFLPPAARVTNPPRTSGPFVSQTETEAYAVFGSLGYELIDRVRATVDLRWNHETKIFDYARGVNLVPDPQRRRTWESWTPRFTLDWRPTDNSLYYISAAKGFKTGGFNDQINIFEAERAYEPETNWTYEIGTRQTLLDRRLFANLTLFYIDWTDQQVVSASAAGAANNTFIANAAQSTSRGFELELNARPTRRLELSAALSLADAQFDEFIDPALVGIDRATGQRATLPGLTIAQLPNGVFGADVSGNQLPRTSKWQGTASAQYTGDINLLGATQWYARADYAYRSRQFAEPSNLAFVGDQHRLNLRAGIEGDRYSLSFWVNNALDDRTPPVIIRFSDFGSFFTPPFVGTLKRAFQVTPADGRTFGATLRFRFGS
jgi:iron complex outermembrane receptor protein